MRSALRARNVFPWLALLAVTGCAQSESAAQQVALMAEDKSTVSFRYLVYATDPPASDLLDRLDSNLLLEPAALRRVETLPATTEDALVAAQWLDNLAEYPPPDRDALRYLGRGLSAEQIDSLDTASGVLVLDFVHPQHLAVTALRRADALVGSLLTVPGTLPFDSEFRRVVDPATWQRERIDDVSHTYPSILRHVAIHAYRDGEWIRAVSVGMGKFGLPELAVDELASAWGEQVIWIINGIGQRMIEGQRPDGDGTFTLDLSQIAQADVRNAIRSKLLSNAAETGRFQLILSIPHEGDNDNSLLDIGFGHYDGVDAFARQQAAVRNMFGWRDEMKRIEPDEALEAASAKARARLPELREVFRRGLQPGEAIQVKLPFDTRGGGTEWMWVEVSRWEDGKVFGVLQNEPFDIPGMHAGQRVTGQVNDVFDYLYQRADGTTEGNETSAIIEAMSGEAERSGAD